MATARPPGFALVFDCGVAGTVEFPELRLGAGSSRTSFPRDLIIQFSDDGRFWENYQSYSNLTYPGDFALTSLVAAANGDPSFSKVSLLLSGDGANGSTTFTDTSPTPKTLTRCGDSQISTVQSKFGGASMYFDGVGDYLSLSASQLIGTSDFTIEAWVRLTSTSVDTEVISIGSLTDSTKTELLFECNLGGVLRGVLRNGANITQVDIESAEVRYLSILGATLRFLSVG